MTTNRMEIDDKGEGKENCDMVKRWDHKQVETYMNTEVEASVLILWYSIEHPCVWPLGIICSVLQYPGECAGPMYAVKVCIEICRLGGKGRYKTARAKRRVVG